MSMWAQGFEPRQDQAKCGPGTKNCGKICIAQEAECHIGKGRLGLAQAAIGAGLVSAGAHMGSQGNNLAGNALALAGIAAFTRGQYNIGRSIGHSTPTGGITKALTITAPGPAGWVPAAIGAANAAKTVRPSAEATSKKVAKAVEPKGIRAIGPTELEAIAAQARERRKQGTRLKARAKM